MTALTKVEKLTPSTNHFDEKQVELIKNSICKGASNEELQFFIYACQRTRLDPFARQIYSVPRGGQRTIQTSVDGFRLIADRTGKYAPGKEPTFEYDKNGNLVSATAYVMKQTMDGTWHQVSANACFNEYNAGSPLWKKMPRAMLSKCAECLALRKAFPAEMSGIYGEEEMEQADVKTCITSSQAIELSQILHGCSMEVQSNFKNHLKNQFKIDMIDDLPEKEYGKIKEMLVSRYKLHQESINKKETIDITEEVEVKDES